MRIRTWLAAMIRSRVSEKRWRQLRYLANEFGHKLRGDKRDDFEKQVERCRLLESSDNIINVSGCHPGI